MTWDRRAVLTGIAGAAACTLVVPRVRAQTPAATVERINDRITVASGLGGNIVLHRSESGLTLVDSGSAAAADALLDVIAASPGQGRVQTLFNTHWHLDQVGGNGALRGIGAEIIAHQKTYARLSTPYYLPTEDRYQAALPVESHPTMRFFDEGEVTAGGQSIRYGYLLEAHTDGDIYVRFDGDNVIAAGDAISPLRDPELDWFGGGWLGGRVDSLRLLLEISDADTRFVPSYGPIVDRAYVQSEHDLMLDLFNIFFERVRAGESAEDIHRSGVLDTLPRRFDDPAKLLYDAHKSIWGHYNTLSHDIV